MAVKVTFSRKESLASNLTFPGLFISTDNKTVVFGVKQLESTILGGTAFIGFVVNHTDSHSRSGDVSTFYSRFFVPTKGTFTYSNED